MRKAFSSPFSTYCITRSSSAGNMDCGLSSVVLNSIRTIQPEVVCALQNDKRCTKQDYCAPHLQTSEIRKFVSSYFLLLAPNQIQTKGLFQDFELLANSNCVRREAIPLFNVRNRYSVLLSNAYKRIAAFDRVRPHLGLA
jgi:hypothetical protein